MAGGDAARNAHRTLRPARRHAIPEGRACEHWARYITFLEVLSETDLLPRIKLVDVVSEVKPYEPIQVDRARYRQFAHLRPDRIGGDAINLNNSYPLKLRDLGQPHLSYAHAFESRVEFSRAFGKDTLSRRSGRGNAFQWLPVRVGTEAMRLAALSRGNEGATGLSSPSATSGMNGRPRRSGAGTAWAATAQRASRRSVAA